MIFAFIANQVICIVLDASKLLTIFNASKLVTIFRADCRVQCARLLYYLDLEVWL